MRAHNGPEHVGFERIPQGGLVTMHGEDKALAHAPGLRVMLLPASPRQMRRGRFILYFSAGLIVLHASTSPCTEATDLANIPFSAASSATSTIFSTPFAPITTGTPT